MTDEAQSRAMRAVDRTLGLLPFVVISGIAVAILLVLGSIRLATTDDTVRAIDQNHDTSVCIVKLFHDLSQSSGSTPEQRAAAYAQTFERENLKASCNLTDEDVDRILKP